jgi:Family of unknown function (DUF6093)
VTVQAAIEQELAFLRDEEEARMVDTWAIGQDGGWQYDDEAGEDVRVITPIFTTPGRLKSPGNVVREAEAGGRGVVETRRELRIPVSKPEVPAGALAECTAVHWTSDPTLLGTIVRLSGPSPSAQTTCRKLEVTEVLT